MSGESQNDATGSALGDLPQHRSVAKGAPVALVLEDDPDSLQIAGTMLGHLGYGVRAAVTPDDAMHILMDDAPALLVVDLCLPMMDGISFIKLVRRMRDLAGVPMIAATGVYDYSGTLTKALAEQGVYSFLSKPYTVAGLREAIDYARTAALRQGPPPECTMLPGGLWEDEEADLRDERHAREAASRKRGLPKALPASDSFRRSAEKSQSQRRSATAAAPAKVRKPTAATAPPRAEVPRPQAAAPKPPERAEPSPAPPPQRPAKPSPSRTSRNVPRPPPPSAPTAPLAPEFSLANEEPVDRLTFDPEVTGLMTLGASEGRVELEDCEASQLVLRTDELQPDDGDTAHLELRFRQLQDDAMKKRRVRVIGTVSQVEGVEAGWRCTLKVTAARPVEHYYALCAMLEEHPSS